MFEGLQHNLRRDLKHGLAQLQPKHHDMFRRMYAPDEPHKAIFFVVDDMPAEKLEWALMQVQRTIEKDKDS